MKLIDDLIGGIPEREGWHASWAFAYRRIGGVNIFYTSEKPVSFNEDFEYVYREEYEAALEASKQPEWNGEGLPPVGCDCLVMGEKGDDDFYKCKILNHTRFDFIDCAVFQTDKTVSVSSAKYFRPLKTQSDMCDEAASALTRILTSLPRDKHVVDWSYAIIEKIISGEIPYVSMPDDAGN